MDCYNDLCVYWKENTCILDNISINEIGLCNEYISVNIPSDEMEKHREEHLQELNKYDRAF